MQQRLHAAGRSTVIQQRLLDDVVPLFELGPAADPVISGSGCSWFLRCGEVIDYFFKCILGVAYRYSFIPEVPRAVLCLSVQGSFSSRNHPTSYLHLEERPVLIG